MARTYERKIVFVVSDTHGGGELGLLSPETKITRQIVDGKDTVMVKCLVSLNESQKILWGHYEEDVAEVQKLAGTDEVIAIHNGDLSQGNKYLDDLAYASIENQIAIACANMKPILRLKTIKKFRLIWGTDSHIFQHASTPQLVERILGLQFPSKDVRSLPHGLFNVSNFWIDGAHHGPTVGGRNWLKGNEMRYYMRDRLRTAFQSGHQMANAILRAHYHTSHEEYMVESYAGIGRHKCVFVLGPSYTFMNEHARKVTRSNPISTVGSYALEIVNGKLLDLHWFKRSYDIRIKEKLA